MHPLSEWGRVKQKLCKQACKIFAFSCQSQLDGIIRAHLRNPWLVLLQPRPARGLLKTILRLAREREELRIVADQFGAPTGAALIADVSAQVLGHYLRSERKENFPSGVFHLAAAGRTSLHGYARHIIETAHRLGIELKATPDKIHAIPATAYPVPAARPANSSLCTEKLEADFGLVLPDWRGGVDRVIELLAFK